MTDNTQNAGDAWIADFRRFADEFKSESDRAAVVLGAAKLDILCYQILQNFLIPSPTGKDELLEADCPLGTFSSRIHMLFRLGLIEADLARALHLIRKIRNSFAHELSGGNLEEGSHRDRIRELIQPLHEAAGFNVLLKDIFVGERNSSTYFRAAVAYLSLRLDGLFERTRTITKPGLTKLLQPEEPEDAKTSK